MKDSRKMMTITGTNKSKTKVLSETAFTLLEVVTAMTILAFISTTVLVAIERSMKKAIDAKSGELNLDVADLTPPTDDAVEQKNILDNAIEHSPSGGVIRLGAKEVHENGWSWIHCTVEDSGPGFETDILPMIFEPFFTRRKNGTGLGLSIARRLVEEIGGKIFAANRPEGGASISVMLRPS